MRHVLPFSFVAVTVLAQNTGRPTFEVASIRPGGSIFSTRPEIANGTIRWSTQLAYLVGYAYDLDFSRVASKQKNFGSVYNVEAKFDASATNEQIRLMVKSLLSDRFKMQAHTVTSTGDGYALLIGKGGIKVSEAPVGRDSFASAILPRDRPGVVEITAKSATFTQLAVTLARSMKTPVWDRTGRSGVYDFHFFYATDPAIGDAPWIGTALQESLGLNLEKQKGPVDTLVVDRIEEPSEN